MNKIFRFVRLAYLPLALVFIGTVFTGAYFSSNVSVSGMSFQAGNWATPAPTPTPIEDVVINELMWMGSIGTPSDEWIELKNLTGNPIDISGWTITGVDSSGNEFTMITVPSGKSISGGGYFLISHYDKAHSAINVDPDVVVNSGVSLSNTHLKIRLYKGAVNASNLEDFAGDGGVPPAGSNGTNKESMARNSLPGVPIQTWYTDSVTNSTTYWDTADGNYGTPGGPNV